jgi:hypothetical protein
MDSRGKAMNLEVNAKFAPKDRPIQVGAAAQVLITPPLDEDYWLARVPLGDNAIVCFPKFTTIGIGFQRETDWNTNLPYSCSAEMIWEHIKHNKADKRIRKPQALKAIKVVQEYARALKEGASGHSQ